MDGWLVDYQKGNWIDLKKGSNGKQIAQINISKANKKLIYDGVLLKQNTLAFEDLDGLLNIGPKYIGKISTIIELEKDTFSLIEKKVNSLKYNLRYHQDIQDDEIIYIKPFLYLPFDSNPFTLPERKSILDFPCAREYKYITTVDIPSGYDYEVPANMNATLNENDIILKYTTSYKAETKKLTMIIDLKLSKTSYTILEYPDFRSAIDSIISKINEPVVLKKI